ncbi:L-asparaginase 1-like isoform X1 [Penaeus monodon]|uniref:L-asparaginase 1-like isoform X1 n=1 Tax=Penaeus monodon TaxID=6687 RepID=UPI0018A7B56C|nr:L-asparaginase 1-like isoform X1 [Penaeus monodon]XP_037800012.1 L-asparaginase 1-like isoform X1 [Penaeus monodon]XP_037800013.1 L-asparaginase 1-like isoform X1 [Penaeus monodon]XP_037800014.1 L-asparaginase 1-like isoform X1 [Penaeus monodon]
MIRTLSSASSLDEISVSYDVPVVDPASVPKVLYGHRTSLDSLCDPDWSQESRVLVLYTGGTIGMVRNDRGKLAPIPRELETNIRRYPHMHDDSYATKRFGCNGNTPLVLPDCKEKRRVAYWVYEYEPLLDSSNMTMDDWIRIAKDIRGVYEMFDGFVVLHGTDTLAYTASALSFMLENLGKPVVITGSQIPIFETRSDGRDNFIGSVIMAGSYNIPEVTVFFNNKLYRGNRTTKVSTGRLQAFDSPNMAPLAIAGISIQVDYRSIFRPTRLEKFIVFDRLNRHVGLLRIFPSISAETVKQFLQPPISGAIIQTYGAGNMPSNRTDIMEVLRDATKRGVILVNTTQCMHGAVDTIYETGEALVSAGVIAGLDMTPEAALTKLSYVLAKSDWDYDTKKRMMMRNLRGEMTVVGQEDEGENQELDVVAAISRALQLSSSDDVERIRDLLVPTLFFTAVSNCDIKRLDEIFSNSTAYGAEVNLLDVSGWSALHMAACDGMAEVVTWLLQHGASVHVRDKQGQTPLKVAVENDHHKVVELLVKTGAHLTESSLRLGEVLVSAAAADSVERLKSYHIAGADLSCADPCGRTALHAACTVGSEECVKFLLEAGVPTNTRDRTDLTPAMCAQVNNHDHLARLIDEQEE